MFTFLRMAQLSLIHASHEHAHDTHRLQLLSAIHADSASEAIAVASWSLAQPKTQKKELTWDAIQLKSNSEEIDCVLWKRAFTRLCHAEGTAQPSSCSRPKGCVFPEQNHKAVRRISPIHLLFLRDWHRAVLAPIPQKECETARKHLDFVVLMQCLCCPCICLLIESGPF